jgi:hypothetical protein
MGVPAEALKITGEVRYFGHKADSGTTATNGFCPACGAPVFGNSSGMPGLLVIKAGSPDNLSLFKAGMNIFTGKRPALRPCGPGSAHVCQHARL